MKASSINAARQLSQKGAAAAFLQGAEERIPLHCARRYLHFTHNGVLEHAQSLPLFIGALLEIERPSGKGAAVF